MMSVGWGGGGPAGKGGVGERGGGTVRGGNLLARAAPAASWPPRWPAAGRRGVPWWGHGPCVVAGGGHRLPVDGECGGRGRRPLPRGGACVCVYAYFWPLVAGRGGRAAALSAPAASPPPRAHRGAAPPSRTPTSNGLPANRGNPLPQAPAPPCSIGACRPEGPPCPPPATSARCQPAARDPAALDEGKGVNARGKSNGRVRSGRVHNVAGAAGQKKEKNSVHPATAKTTHDGSGSRPGAATCSQTAAPDGAQKGRKK